MDITIDGLDIGDFTLKSAHVPLARSVLTSFNSLRRLRLGNDMPLDFLTNEFLVALKQIGVVDFEFRSKPFKRAGRGFGGRALRTTYDGNYPDLDAGLTAFLFRGTETDEPVNLRIPAARVPQDFCQRLLKVSST